MKLELEQKLEILRKQKNEIDEKITNLTKLKTQLSDKIENIEFTIKHLPPEK